MSGFADIKQWSQTAAAVAEGAPMYSWHPLTAEDVHGERIGHGWDDVEGLMLDLGLMVRPSDDSPFITLVPWHEIAWVRWAPRDTPEG